MAGIGAELAAPMAQGSRPSRCPASGRGLQPSAVRTRIDPLSQLAKGTADRARGGFGAKVKQATRRRQGLRLKLNGLDFEDRSTRTSHPPRRTAALHEAEDAAVHGPSLASAATMASGQFAGYRGLRAMALTTRLDSRCPAPQRCRHQRMEQKREEVRSAKHGNRGRWGACIIRRSGRGSGLAIRQAVSWQAGRGGTIPNMSCEQTAADPVVTAALALKAAHSGRPGFSGADLCDLSATGVDLSGDGSKQHGPASSREVAANREAA